MYRFGDSEAVAVTNAGGGAFVAVKVNCCGGEGEGCTLKAEAVRERSSGAAEAPQSLKP
jgi:hypothetical protein